MHLLRRRGTTPPNCQNAPFHNRVSRATERGRRRGACEIRRVIVSSDGRDAVGARRVCVSPALRETCHDVDAGAAERTTRRRDARETYRNNNCGENDKQLAEDNFWTVTEYVLSAFFTWDYLLRVYIADNRCVRDETTRAARVRCAPRVAVASRG